jgi:hypothetical protein
MRFLSFGKKKTPAKRFEPSPPGRREERVKISHFFSRESTYFS